MPHQPKLFCLTATALWQTRDGDQIQTMMIPVPAGTKVYRESTNYLALHEECLHLAKKATPILRDLEHGRLPSDTFAGVRVAVGLAKRGERAPAGFKDFRGYDFKVEELDLVPA